MNGLFMDSDKTYTLGNRRGGVCGGGGGIVPSCGDGGVCGGGGGYASAFDNN